VCIHLSKEDAGDIDRVNGRREKHDRVINGNLQLGKYVVTIIISEVKQASLSR
jgi:hypothetical protein